MASKKQEPRPRRIPQRTCIACRQPSGKRNLIRLVRGADGVEVDLTGKQAGRGAYLCNSLSCWTKAVETNRIGSALRTKLTDVDLQTISNFMDTLTMENHV